MSKFFDSRDIAPLDTFLKIHFQVPRSSVLQQAYDQVFTSSEFVSDALACWFESLEEGKWVGGVLVRLVDGSWPAIPTECHAYIELAWNGVELLSQVAQIGHKMGLSEVKTGLDFTSWTINPDSDSGKEVLPVVASITQGFIAKWLVDNAMGISGRKTLN